MNDKRKKSFMKKWIVNGSTAAALVAAIVVFVIMLQVEKNTLTQYERGTIFVAGREIPKGQMITEENYSEYFEKMQLDKNVIPATAICQVEQIAGLVAEMDIEKGVLLTKGMFKVLDEITAQMEAPVIVGLKAEDLYQVVGGTLRAGDRIHIYRMDAETGMRVVWEDIYIQSVFDQTGRCIPNDDEETAVQRMNVYLDKKDVEAFYAELTTGNLRIAKAAG